MPELPDVENFKRYLDATALHKTIEEVSVGTAKILRGITGPQLARALHGRRLESSRRHGKHLFAALDEGHWLTLHFGMTGRLQYFKDMADDPEHDRLRLDFDNGYHLAYVNQRLFGEVGLIDDPDALIARSDLGPDALALARDADAFAERLGHRRGQIKSALMDQSLLAGIGNVYSDEIAYQARMHPRARVDNFDRRTREELAGVTRRVLQDAIDMGAGSEALFDNLPDDWLLGHRGKREACPRCGERIATVNAAGRKAYYCPRCQPG